MSANRVDIESFVEGMSWGVIERIDREVNDCLASSEARQMFWRHFLLRVAEKYEPVDGEADNDDG